MNSTANTCTAPPVLTAAPRWHGWALATLVLWALVLRLWFATYSHGDRDVDEKFNAKNVVAIVETGSLRPDNGWYGTLSYLPHAALAAMLQSLSATLEEPRLATVRDHRITAFGIFACRALQVLFGIWSLVLTRRLGQRLFGPPVGLVGAFLLAVSFLHINYSADFKPDVELLALMLLAFLWTLDAADDPTPRNYLLTGLGIGLAGACKFNGALIALPLLLATALWSARRVRGWVALALAGGIAGGVFAIFNPYLLSSLAYMSRLHNQYLGRGIEENEGHLLTLVRSFAFPFDERWHGPWVALLALGGVALIAAAVLDRRGPEPERRERVLFLAWPLLYVGAYALLTTFAKLHNFLPVVPFTALAAAYLGVALWRRGVHRAPSGARPALLAVPLVFFGWQAERASLFVYQAVVPTTSELVGRHLAGFPSPGGRWRIVVLEEGVDRSTVADSSRAGRRREPVTMIPVSALGDVSDRRLDHADAEVFAALRLRGPAADRYLARLARPGVTVHRFEQGLALARGNDLIEIAHPFAAGGEPRPLRLDRRGREACTSPVLGDPVTLVSLDALAPPCQGGPPTVGLRVDETPTPLIELRQERRGDRWVSERFWLDGAGSEICLTFAEAECVPEEVEATLRTWQVTPPAGSPAN